MGQTNIKDDFVDDIKPIKIKNTNKNNLIKTLQQIINLCELDTYNSTSILKKASASDSTQIIGRLQGKDIFIKLFFRSFHPLYNNSMIVESMVYSCIVPDLIENNTPFLLKFYGYQDCPGFMNNLINSVGPFYEFPINDFYLKLILNSYYTNENRFSSYDQKDTFIFKSNTILEFLEKMKNYIFRLEDVTYIRNKFDQIEKGMNISPVDMIRKLDELILIFENAFKNCNLIDKANQQTKLLSNLTNIYINEFGNLSKIRDQKIGVLVLNQVPEPRIKLEDWLLPNKTHTPEEIRSVLFQIFWTLHCFYKIGLRHNDLHLGNIWVVEQKTLKYNKFVLNDWKSGKNIEFIVPIKQKILIYDFDRSSIIDLTTNKKMKDTYCPLGFGCDNKNDGYDSYKFMCSFMGQLRCKIDTENSYEKIFYDQLSNIHKIISEEIPIFKKEETKLNDFHCVPAIKKDFENEYTDEGMESFKFIDQELIIRYHLDTILNENVFFESFRNNNVKNINKMKSYHEPNELETQTIEKNILQKFPDSKEPKYEINNIIRPRKIILNLKKRDKIMKTKINV